MAKTFVNDDEYANLFGLGGKKAKEIDAQTNQIATDTANLRQKTDAQMIEVAKKLQEAEDNTKKAQQLEDELKAKLEDSVKNKIEVEKVVKNIKTQTTQTIASSNMKKYILIGAGIIGFVVVIALVVKK